jgi:hypothetical protein
VTEIPAIYIAQLIQEWKRHYGPTYPLYGNETKRHDISGSVRPLLPSTEISYEATLAAISQVKQKLIEKICKGEIESVSFEMADVLIQSMELTYAWFEPPLNEYY